MEDLIKRKIPVPIVAVMLAFLFLFFCLPFMYGYIRQTNKLISLQQKFERSKVIDKIGQMDKRTGLESWYDRAFHRKTNQ
jgi:hypothetical protein